MVKGYGLLGLVFVLLILGMGFISANECSTDNDCDAEPNGHCREYLWKCDYCSDSEYYNWPQGCVECLEDSECNDNSNGYCGLLNNCHYCSEGTYWYQTDCVECTEDSECNDNSNGYCDVLGECHYCTDSEIPNGVQGCIDCNVDNDCDAEPNGYCYTYTGDCRYCGANEYFSMYGCVECLADYECGTGENCNALHNCVTTVPTNTSSGGGSGQGNSTATVPTNTSSGGGIISCEGCNLNEKCYPVNNRKNGSFCSVDKEWIIQNDEGASCEDNFECKSNLCVENECISGTWFKKIIEWFENWFN